MANREMITRIQVRNVLAATVINNTTPRNSTPIDTVEHANGVGFVMGCTAFTSGTASIKIQEADLVGGPFTDITREQTVQQPLVDPAISALSVLGVSNYVRIGAFATKKFIRAVVTGANTPNLTIEVKAVMNPQLVPDAKDGSTVQFP